MRSLFMSIALIAAVALTACGGGASSSKAVPGSLPAAAAAASHGTLSIVVPAKGATTSSRGKQYVSAASQSASIAITPSSGCTNCSNAVTIAAGLTFSSTGCSTDANGTTCAIPLALQPGSYTAAIAIYDGPISASQPTGNILSQNQIVPITIAAGQPNVVTVSLDGIPAGVIFQLVGGPATQYSPTRVALNALGQTAIVGIETVDADGGVIVGPGVPPITATVFGTPVTSPVVNNSVTIALGAPTILNITNGNAPVAGNTPIVVTVQSPLCPSVQACTATLYVAQAQVFAVANTGGHNVQIWPVNGMAPTTSIPITGQPNLVLFDRSGNLFVSDNMNNTIAVYAPPYTSAPTATITAGLNNTQAIALAPNGDLFAMSPNNNAVTRYAAPYTGGVAGTTTAGVNNPAAMVVDSIGTLFVANAGNNTLTAYTAPYAGIHAQTGTGIATPDALLLGNFGFSGDIAVLNSANSTVTVYDSSGSLGAPAKTLQVDANATALGDAGGALLVGTYSATVNVFGQIANPGNTALTATLTSVLGPTSIASDSYGSAYVTNYTSTTVDRIDPPFISGPVTISYPGFTSPHSVAMFPF